MRHNGSKEDVSHEKESGRVVPSWSNDQLYITLPLPIEKNSSEDSSGNALGMIGSWTVVFEQPSPTTSALTQLAQRGGDRRAKGKRRHPWRRITKWRWGNKFCSEERHS
ncbi:hypothetical protein DdX_18275 [Ditylenchus destructor]|uniref:Uncharacterized protein n=1 Tax=Ditylenchus destructor TaxID=166010 RepID=A0AAD4MQD0_9BILA|nr:hypothetical protein DdX_18275 [Ditylenchus destructor]